MGVKVAPTVPQSRRANKMEVAEFFGVSLPTIDAWIRRGCPNVQKGSRGVSWVFDLLQVAEWRFTGERVPDNEVSPEDMHPKDRKDWYEGEKVRIALEVEKGNLITLDQYREEMARILKQVANTLETLPDSLERKCGISPSVVTQMVKEIDGERAALAERLLSTDVA